MDTAVALFFPQGVHKAVLYQKDGEKVVLKGKTGFGIAVVARAIAYEDNRIDLRLKAGSKADYFVQIPRIGFDYMLSKTPALENISRAEMKAFHREKEVNRPGFLWAHIFTGLFLMFFIFGLIKYLVLGKDKAYLYFALMGLSNALFAVALTEYPPFELSWFENIRSIDLSGMMNELAILTQGLFNLEILQLKSKYPRVARGIKGFYFYVFSFGIVYTTVWIATHKYPPVFSVINSFNLFVLFFLAFSLVGYLATIRKGFYRFIFLGALTMFIAFTLLMLVWFFDLFYLLPDWFGDDKVKSVNHFMQIAILADMIFYFTGLTHRDRQVEEDKILFQEQLIKQLEANEVLQKRFRGELEQQVQQKTAELIQQREAFETEKEAKLLADFNRKFSESELKALRSQMNPHFLFNILNTIESYALENNKEAASVTIQKFSLLTRLVLENSMNPLVLFEQDWKALKLYVELEQMRYAEKFVTVYDIPQEVLEGEYFIPPMIVQPFVENAILHGLRNKPDGEGILRISAYLQDANLVVEVEDNGIGRAKATQLKAGSPFQRKSVGIKVTQDRISIFNNLNPDKKAKAEIEDLKKGTRVTIQLPKQTR